MQLDHAVDFHVLISHSILITHFTLGEIVISNMCLKPRKHRQKLARGYISCPHQPVGRLDLKLGTRILNKQPPGAQGCLRRSQ